jgi:hypothetical protein
MTDKARPASEIAEGLRDWSDNRDDDSANALLKLVYAELHRQAHRYLQKERVGHTLQTTAFGSRGLSQISRAKIGCVGEPFSLLRHCCNDDAANFD